MRKPKLLRFTLAAILLTTAALKLASASGAFDLSIVATAIELGVAIWLLSGAKASIALKTAAALFAIFAGVNLYTALADHRSCGCFGNAIVSPWITFVFDACSLVVAARARGLLTNVYAALIVPAMAAIVVVNTDWSVQRREFDPSQWIGRQPAPLFWAVDEPRLLHGRWTLVLHRAACPRCKAFFDRGTIYSPETSRRLSCRENHPA